ncbi:MAG TPA: serine/threonine protein kinase, partial [Nannocystis exedens]|nr:serine/threonine protein kinase [Nannocystis exedens]
MNPFPFLDETMASVEGQDPGGAAGLSAEAKAASLDETHLEDPALASNQPAIGAGSIRIGRYAVLSKLGEGGMGTVYSAYDEELDRRVAIKLVREHLPGK